MSVEDLRLGRKVKKNSEEASVAGAEWVRSSGVMPSE